MGILKFGLRAQSTLRIVAAGALFAAAWVMPVPAQAAVTGASLSVQPDFPPTVKVGDKGVAVDLTLQNTSEHMQGKITINPGALRLTPSCGSIPGGAAPPCPNPDRNIFATSGSGTGRAGSDCAGGSFSITPVEGSSTGEVQFSGPPITLAGTDNNNSNGGRCFIDFTVDVLKAPTLDADSGEAGIQTSQLAIAPGLTEARLRATGIGSSATAVARGQVVVTTQATPNAVVGGPISDTATLSASGGGKAPTGTLTFQAFGPNDPICSGAPAFTAPPANVTGPGNYVSGPFTPAVPGTYIWLASYSGDVNYAPATHPCGEPSETSTVRPDTPPPPSNPPPGGPPNSNPPNSNPPSSNPPSSNPPSSNPPPSVTPPGTTQPGNPAPGIPKVIKGTQEVVPVGAPNDLTTPAGSGPSITPSPSRSNKPVPGPAKRVPDTFSSPRDLGKTGLPALPITALALALISLGIMLAKWQRSRLSP